MNHEQMPYVLVAERSVLPGLRLVLKSLRTYGNPASISIVVPSADLADFHLSVASDAQVVPESDVLPGWSIRRVRDMLPGQQNRAGWYLQQFLKLTFGFFAEIPRYVVWDADTVLLAPVAFMEGDVILANTAHEYHREYFDTFQRLFGYEAPLSRSAICQYMVAETEIIRQMRTEIEARSGKDWIKTILEGLPRTSSSEFSEYETYVNFLAKRHPQRLKLNPTKWFRYGAEIIGDMQSQDLETLKRQFRGYSYVAFERHHRRSILKDLGSRMLLMMGRSA